MRFYNVIIMFIVLNLMSCSFFQKQEQKIPVKWKHAVISTTIKIVSPMAVKLLSCKNEEGLQNYVIDKISPKFSEIENSTKGFIFGSLYSNSFHWALVKITFTNTPFEEAL